MKVQEESTRSFLSLEQTDTDRLIRQLLGTAVADRYVDFCHLVSGRLPLIVSRPLAGHALRELNSLLRHVLATPMDAKAPDSAADAIRRGQAIDKLKELGFDEPTLQRADGALKPRYTHKKQIEKIVARLGMSPGSDIAKLWIKLNEAYGRVHERSFHVHLKIDETFQAEFVRPFDKVIRALMLGLQSRYAALMRRVKEIAAMHPSEGIRPFVSEIPGAIQLQSYFYDHLQSSEWLPYLAREGILTEPLPDPYGGNLLRLWSWPVGQYLVRMASSEDKEVRAQVVQAIRSLQSSTNPDVHRFGMDVIEALPASEATELVYVLEHWIGPSTDLFTAAPHKIITKLAAAGDIASAMRVVRCVFELFDRGGDVAAHFDAVMYEHYLEGTIKALAAAQPLKALPMVCALLMDSSRYDRRLSNLSEADYSYCSIDSFEPESVHGHGFLGSLVMAAARLGAAAIRAKPSDIQLVLEQLKLYRAKIFIRMRLYLLALEPAAAPEIVAAYLTDLSLVDRDWCREEYAKLARAWFGNLTTPQQDVILDYIKSIPDNHIANWRVWFEKHEKRKPDALDERRYRETTIRDVVWLWRSALPPTMYAAVEKTVDDFGDPDQWRQHYFRPAESPLTRATMLEQPVETTAAFLANWAPDSSQQRSTADALADELREASALKPDLFSRAALSFAPLRPLFIRHLFDGLRQSMQQKVAVDWVPCLSLIQAVIEGSKDNREPSDRMAGDDPDWSLTLKAMMEWLSLGLQRGTDGPPFESYATLRDVVSSLVIEANVYPSVIDQKLLQSRNPFILSQETLPGSATNLLILFLFWSSKDVGNAVGRAPPQCHRQGPQLAFVI